MTCTDSLIILTHLRQKLNFQVEVGVSLYIFLINYFYFSTYVKCIFLLQQWLCMLFIYLLNNYLVICYLYLSYLFSKLNGVISHILNNMLSGINICHQKTILVDQWSKYASASF